MSAKEKYIPLWCFEGVGEGWPEGRKGEEEVGSKLEHVCHHLLDLDKFSEHR